MITVVIVLLVLFVLGLIAVRTNAAWAPYGTWIDLVGALLLILCVLRVFGLWSHA